MIRNIFGVALAFVLTVTATRAFAQVEPVGPLTLVPNQPINLFYTNVIPPNPAYKEFEFRAMVNVPAGAIGQLLVDFDYIDASGAAVLVPAPNSPFLIPGGIPVTISSGIFRLPFCPREVSLHLTNGSGTNIPMELRGQYRHECFPVPEPASVLGSAMLAAFGLLIRRRQK